MAHKSGKTVLNMKACGSLIEPKVKASSSMQKEIFTKVNFKMTKQMDMEYIRM